MATVVHRRHASPAPLSPVMEARRGESDTSSDLEPPRTSIRRLSNGMVAVDTLLRSAVDARRALSLVITEDFQAKNLRHAVEHVVLPAIAAMANFCACDATLRARAAQRQSAKFAPHFEELPAVTFEELGHEVTLTPSEALDGLMCSLTASKPPMACYYSVRWRFLSDGARVKLSVVGARVCQLVPSLPSLVWLASAHCCLDCWVACWLPFCQPRKNVCSRHMYVCLVHGCLADRRKHHTLFTRIGRTRWPSVRTNGASR